MTTEFNLSKKKFPKETWEDRARESKTLENKRIANQTFNLSEKVLYYGSVNSGKVIQEDDVKEFIRLLKEELRTRIASEIEEDWKKIIDEEIDKLAGEKLNGI